MAASQCFMVRSGGVFQRLQIGFYSGVVDSQKLVGRGHHVDAVGLALGAFLVHELVDRFIQRSVLQIDTHDKEQRSPQRRRANFAHALVSAGHITGIIWWSIQSSVAGTKSQKTWGFPCGLHTQFGNRQLMHL